MPKLSPMHPGEVLREEFMKPFGLSAYTIAKHCGDIPRTRIERLAKEKIGLSADTALRLGKFFGTTPEFWLNLQKRYELETTASEIKRELEAVETRESIAA